MIKITSRIIVLIILCISLQTATAQWNSNTSINTPVITAAGKQIDLRMLEDGKGGAFIAWKDYRAGLPDIYIQYLDSAGYRLWDTNGVALCTNPYDQSTPAITTDMTGGAIVAWSDWRSGIERDVYTQRIDSFGVIQWTLDGVGVANKPQREHNEKIISDGAGGAIVTWEQQSSTTGQWDIWCQKISHTGTLMWPVGGIPLCTVVANRLNPKVQKDGFGGSYVTWQDYRTLTDYNVYAQHVRTDGTLAWGGNALLVCGAADAQLDPKIDPDSVSGGVYITWIDKRNLTDYDIYAQRVDSTGALMWAADGVPVTLAVGNQGAQDMLSTPMTDGIIVTWKDNRFNNYDIYAQKLNSSGVPQWMFNGVSLCSSMHDQLNPNIVDDLAGGAIVTWQDSIGVDWDIRTQRVDANGNTMWLANGEAVCTATGIQTSPKNVSDGKGGSIYAWQDKRTGTADVYAQHIYHAPISHEGIDENNINGNISVYPNPFTDNFEIAIDLINDECLTVTAFDVIGQVVPMNISNTTIQAKGKHTIKVSTDKSEVTAGIYFIQIKGNGWMKMLKVVKS